MVKIYLCTKKMIELPKFNERLQTTNPRIWKYPTSNNLKQTKPIHQNTSC